jgi:Glycoside Hydrolase Family 113
MLCACQSSGQQEKPPKKESQGFSHRRSPPQEVLDSLPYDGKLVLKTAHFEFFAHGAISPQDVQRLAGASENSVAAIFQFTDYKDQLPMFRHHLYVSAEEKGLMLNNSTHAHVDIEAGEIHTVLNEIYNDNFTGKENELVLHHILGPPKTEALLHGLAIFFTENWQRKGYRHWAARLAAGNFLPGLPDLLNMENWAQNSEMIAECLSATFVEFLTGQWGRNFFLERYATWQPNEMESLQLEVDWHGFLAQLAEAEELAVRTAPPPLPYLKGFNFTHEGYRIYNGYGSRLARHSVDEMKALGSNAMALIPYSFLRNPNVPATIPVVKYPGSETDEAVIASAFYAKKQGLAVMLKPQIWLGHGQWPGDIKMSSDAGWKTFFGDYSYWMAHYALLAELYDLDLLCIGTEMAQTTRIRPSDWRYLIHRLRKLYSGSLTYAANWGEEFENITIWDDLDYIGLNCYYPLSSKDNPTQQELESGFAVVLSKIDRVWSRYHKPVIFTEIGFASVDRPWKEPHVDWGGHAYNEQDQKTCYEIIFKGIRHQPWCKGILWWKFPSYLRQSERSRTGFSPWHKAAEEVVKNRFSDM